MASIIKKLFKHAKNVAVAPLYPTRTLRNTVGFVTGKGNIPGSPTSRKLGYEPDEVADAAVAQLTAPTTMTTNPQGQLILAGAAGVALLMLLGGGKKGRR